MFHASFAVEDWPQNYFKLRLVIEWLFRSKICVALYMRLLTVIPILFSILDRMQEITVRKWNFEKVNVGQTAISSVMGATMGKNSTLLDSLPSGQVGKQTARNWHVNLVLLNSKSAATSRMLVGIRQCRKNHSALSNEVRSVFEHSADDWLQLREDTRNSRSGERSLISSMGWVPCEMCR